MKVVCRRLDAFAHEVDIEGGHSLVVDEPASAGGSDTGPPPTRLLAASLASCTAITMEIYAERKGWDIGAVEVDVDVEYEGHVPTDFSVTLRLPSGLSDEQKHRLHTVAGKCPVHRALTGETRITIGEKIEAL